MRIRHWIAWGLLVLVVLAVGGTAWGFSAAGYEKYVVETGSMSPGIMPGDLVIDRPTASGYTVGDVITFRHGPEPDLVTHRIVEITDDGIKTKGDANETEDSWTIPTNYVVGVVAWVIPKGGYVVLFLGQPAGIASVLLGVVGLVLLWRLFFPSEDTDGNPSTTDSDALNPEPEGAHEVPIPAPPSVGRHAVDNRDSPPEPPPGTYPSPHAAP